MDRKRLKLLELKTQFSNFCSIVCMEPESFFPLFFQFVPFRDFQTHGTLAQDLLSKEVLAELPDQLLSFMTTHMIKPKPPRPISVDNIVPIMPQSGNQTAPYPTNPSTPPYSASQSIPYSTNQGPPYPIN